MSADLPLFGSYPLPPPLRKPFKHIGKPLPAGDHFAPAVHNYLYTQGNPVNGVVPSGHDELKAITGSWSVGSQEYEVITHDPETRAILDNQKIIRIGYRPIRELQRRLRKSAGQ